MNFDLFSQIPPDAPIVPAMAGLATGGLGRLLFGKSLPSQKTIVDQTFKDQEKVLTTKITAYSRVLRHLADSPMDDSLRAQHAALEREFRSLCLVGGRPITALVLLSHYLVDTVDSMEANRHRKNYKKAMSTTFSTVFERHFGDFGRRLNTLVGQQKTFRQQERSKHRVKEITEQKIEISRPPTEQLVGSITPEEIRLGKIEARITTLSSHENISKKQQQELEAIDQTLVSLDSSADSPLDAGKIDALRTQIQVLLSRANTIEVPASAQTSGEGGVSEEYTEHETLEENRAYIDYIRFIRSEATNYKLSSQKRGESVGDGNFLSQVFRPFLAQLEDVLISNKIDAREFSWREVVEVSQAHIDGIANRTRLHAFILLLARHEEVTHWKDNWKHLISTIEGFSRDERFFPSSKKAVPLSNILPTLRDHPPSER